MTTHPFPQRFQGRPAVVTGAARGIGLGIARRLGQEGALLTLADSNAATLEAAAEALRGEGMQVTTEALDVTDAGAVQAVMERVVQREGRIDALVTAAGILGTSGVLTEALSLEEFDQVMRVNLHGIFHCVRAVLPHMRAAGYGRIFNLASISGKDGNAGMLAYSTSKAAVIGLTKVVGKEYAEYGITCNTIAPALIDTDMIKGLPAEKRRALEKAIPQGRVGQVEEVAAVAAFALSPECSFTTGFVFDASGGRTLY